MKNMTKLIAIVMCVAACFAFAACGSKAPAASSAATEAVDTAAATEAVDTAATTDEATTVSAASLEGTTWVVVSSKSDSGELTGDQLAQLLGGEVTYEFKADGVITATLAGKSYDGTYEEGDGTVTTVINGVTTQMTYDGESISYDSNGGTCILAQK